MVGVLDLKSDVTDSRHWGRGRQHRRSVCNPFVCL